MAGARAFQRGKATAVNLDRSRCDRCVLVRIVGRNRRRRAVRATNVSGADAGGHRDLFLWDPDAALRRRAFDTVAPFDSDTADHL